MRVIIAVTFLSPERDSYFDMISLLVISAIMRGALLAAMAEAHEECRWQPVDKAG
jgi:hypothetical protein